MFLTFDSREILPDGAGAAVPRSFGLQSPQAACDGNQQAQANAAKITTTRHGRREGFGPSLIGTYKLLILGHNSPIVFFAIGCCKSAPATAKSSAAKSDELTVSGSPAASTAPSTALADENPLGLLFEPNQIRQH
jgi:hypothetical protein